MRLEAPFRMFFVVLNKDVTCSPGLACNKVVHHFYVFGGQGVVKREGQLTGYCQAILFIRIGLTQFPTENK